MEKDYKVISGMSFDVRTPDAVCNALVKLNDTRERVRIFLGDMETGRAWSEEYDVIGTIGKSCGKVKIPLMIYNSRSTGGPAILDHCIVKIISTAYVDGYRVIYQHPAFSLPAFSITESKEKGYTHSVLEDGKVYANCASYAQAVRLMKFMTGNGMQK